MDITVVKKLIETYKSGHESFIRRASEARRYYENETDILLPEGSKAKSEKEEMPLRNADNRIPFNFHGLLVNQKAAYMFSAPPLFDLGAPDANKKLSSFLGDDYPKVCKDLCAEASNCGVGWIHLWMDEKGRWEYAVVPAEQIIPVWSSGLKKTLAGAFRCYDQIDEIDGETYTVYEYWTDKECAAYRLKAGDRLEALQEHRMFLAQGMVEPSATYRHKIGEVPFFPFFNNNINTNDLKNIKPLIDTYCKVFSGFVNDLEDIQEVIFVLTNYGGEDLGQFMRELKNYKAIQIENEGEGDRSGVSTLTIELPVEAREKLLAVTRKCIFEQGMGIDPDPQNFGNSSGVALKFLYSLIEQKAGLQQTEFTLSLARFIRCACRVLGIPIKDDAILQTWTRTSVQNDLELSQIAAQSKSIISDETIRKNHPWVENPEDEAAAMKAQEREALGDLSDILPPKRSAPDDEGEEDE